MPMLAAGDVCSLASGSVCEENDPQVQLLSCTIKCNILIF